MRKIVSVRPRAELSHRDTAEANPLWALAVGLVYVFRTAPGHRILRDLERAVRRYAADPAALFRLVRGGDDVIDASARETPELPEPR